MHAATAIGPGRGLGTGEPLRAFAPRWPIGSNSTLALLFPDVELTL